MPLRADTIRIASFAAPLSRDGPGLLLRDILADAPALSPIRQAIDQINPDILLLTDFDWDAGGSAMAAFGQTLAQPYPHHISAAPNGGALSGLDLNGNDRRGEARDAWGYGRFFGDGGMALLSRYPLVMQRDLTDLLWRDLPGAVMPRVDDAPFPSETAQAAMRLSSNGHWIVQVTLPDGAGDLTLLAFDATPPVFDGDEDMNGLRNRDELRLWAQVLDGALGPVPRHPIVIGNANLDATAGQGLRAAMVDFLARPDLQDPAPRSAAGIARGHPVATADWGGDLGALRVSYVLPSSGLRVVDAGVFWPQSVGDDAGNASGPHRLVWVDIAPP